MSYSHQFKMGLYIFCRERLTIVSNFVSLFRNTGYGDLMKHVNKLNYYSPHFNKLTSKTESQAKNIPNFV